MAQKAIKHTNLPTFVLDGGNAWVKYLCGGIEGRYPHALAELTPAKYRDEVDKYGKTAGMDFMELDGKYFATGVSAQNYLITARTGRSKYERGYYGVLFANAVARTFIADPEQLAMGLRVMASHASADSRFADIVRSSLKGKWDFMCGDKRFKFEVLSVDTYEETFGSYCLQAFVQSKRGITTPLFGKTVGVLDIGGGTCGVLGITPDGNIMANSSRSGTTGVNNARENLRGMLEEKYRDLMRHTSKLPTDRLEHALKTGVYNGYGRELNCFDEVERSLTPLLNEAQNLYMAGLNGGAGIDLMILTGGGNIVLLEKVIHMLDHGNAVAADIPDRLQYANVHGAGIFDSLAQETI